MRKTLKDAHEAECSLNPANILQRSTADAEQEDAAMEESEEVPTRESESLVLSEDEATTLPILNIVTEAMHAASCTSHPSQAQQASPGGADDAGLAGSAMEESNDEPTRESESAVKTKRVFNRRNAAVENGNYVCNTCKLPVCKAT